MSKLNSLNLYSLLYRFNIIYEGIMLETAHITEYSKGTEVNLLVDDEVGLQIHLEDEDSAKGLLEY